MKKKIYNLIYLFKKITNKIIRIFSYRFYGNIYSLRSECDDGFYLSFVSAAIQNKKIFSTFRKNLIYQNVLDHTNYDLGLKYLTCIKRDNPDFFNKIDIALENDLVGSPNMFFYEDIGKRCSPATLRYLKITSDIKKLFGDKFSHYVEVGCGYGGQALLNDRFLKIDNMTLIDLYDVTILIQKYLESYILNSSFKTSTYNTFQEGNKKIDLFVSNYAFSEFNTEVQKKYLEKLICKSERGYIIMNSGKFGTAFGDKKHLNINEIKNYLPDIKVMNEEPISYKGNYVLYWGSKKT